jgi:glucose-6-phosphate isomerase
VELGKTQANSLLPVLIGDAAPAEQSDSSTDALVRHYRAERGRSA